MEGEEYEIIPHEVLSDLKDEVHLLKERLSRPLNEEEKELVKKIDLLSHELDELKAMINSAVKSVEGSDEDPFSEAIKGINNKLDTLENQNEQIAKALITLSSTNQKLSGKIDAITLMLTKKPMQQTGTNNYGPQTGTNNYVPSNQMNAPGQMQQGNIPYPQKNQQNMSENIPKQVDMRNANQQKAEMPKELPPIEEAPDDFLKEKKKSIFDIFK